jgi:hypothetical protein
VARGGVMAGSLADAAPLFRPFQVYGIEWHPEILEGIVYATCTATELASYVLELSASSTCTRRQGYALVLAHQISGHP